MAEKYIVQNNSITKIVYIGGCQSAKGGRQKVQEQADILQNYSWSGENFDYGLVTEQIASGTKIHGEYHNKNYRARKKKRKQIIEELIFNNFEPHNSCMLTLTFMKYCSKQGKTEKAAPCGTYSACEICQYRFFYIGIMRENFGADLILTREEQNWLDNVYAKLSREDLNYVKAKYEPEVPTAYRPKKKEV